MVKLPFNQNRLSENKVIRTFYQDTPDEELKWHRDAEDRYVKSIGETDWKLQFDNKLPQKISYEYVFIPKGVYHRVIKGTGDLKVEVIME
jgi:hypothetical protein